MQWCAAKSTLLTGESTVTIYPEEPQRSSLGGKLSNILDTGAWSFVLSHAEIVQHVSTYFVLVLVTVGDALFRAPGIMIGNPMGRLALACTTVRDTFTFEEAWNAGTLDGDKWGPLAKAGWKREQVVGCEVYVDDWRGHSLVACTACLASLPATVFRRGFEPAKTERSTSTWMHTTFRKNQG